MYDADWQEDVDFDDQYWEDVDCGLEPNVLDSHFDGGSPAE